MNKRVITSSAALFAVSMSVPVAITAATTPPTASAVEISASSKKDFLYKVLEHDWQESEVEPTHEAFLKKSVSHQATISQYLIPVRTYLGYIGGLEKDYSNKPNTSRWLRKLLDEAGLKVNVEYQNQVKYNKRVLMLLDAYNTPNRTMPKSEEKSSVTPGVLPADVTLKMKALARNATHIVDEAEKYKGYSLHQDIVDNIIQKTRELKAVLCLEDDKVIDVKSSKVIYDSSTTRKALPVFHVENYVLLDAENIKLQPGV